MLFISFIHVACCLLISFLYFQSSSDYDFDFYRNSCFTQYYLLNQLKGYQTFVDWIETDSKKRKLDEDDQMLPEAKFSRSILSPNPFQYRRNNSQDRVLLELMIKKYYYGEPKYYVGYTQFLAYYSLDEGEGKRISDAFFVEEQDRDMVIEFLEKLKQILKDVSSQESHVNSINSLIDINAIEKSMIEGMSGRELMELFEGVRSFVYNTLIPLTGVCFPSMSEYSYNPVNECVGYINNIVVCLLKFFLFLFYLFQLLCLIIFVFQMGLSIVWVHYAGTGLDTTIEDSPDDLMTQISDISRELMMDYSDQRNNTKVCLGFLFYLFICIVILILFIIMYRSFLKMLSVTSGMRPSLMSMRCQIPLLMWILANSL